MYQFFVFARKEFYHIFRDRRTLLILFGMPVVQIILFGFAITNEIKHAKIAVLDQANDYYSQRMVQRLSASGYFDVVRHVPDQAAITDIFREGRVQLTVVIPATFTRDFFHKREAQVQLLADASDPNMATTLVNYAQVIIAGYQQELNAAADLPLTIDTLVRMEYNPSLKSVFLFVPGVMTLILLLVSAMMTSITIAREKELGTMEILLVSPLPPVLIITGKVMPYILLSFINALVILGLGVTLFGMPVKGSLVLLLFECVLFVLTSLSLGILISTVTATQQAAMMASMMGLLMPTVMLSGFVFPIESMPKPLQVISHVMPARWFISLLKDIMLKGSGLKDVWVQTVVLGGMTLFFLGLSIRKFKIRLS